MNKKTNNDVQNITQKTNNWAKWFQPKTGGEFMCPGTVSSSSTTSDTRGVYHVTKLLTSHAWGKHRIVITTNGKLSSLISKVFGVHNTIHKSKNWGIIMEFVPSKKEFYSRYTTLLKPYKQRTPINIFYHLYLNN